MPRLAVRLGLPADSLWVKRDDLTGVAAGGNKARKLEPVLQEALTRGATHVVTGGRVQSNHCAMTAAAAARIGLECTLVLAGQPPLSATGNHLLVQLFGACQIFVEDRASQDLEAAIVAVHQELLGTGVVAELVPLGASTPRGCVGYVEAADEIHQQLGLDPLVVVATGSGGTHAGLVAGFGDHAQVLGVRVDERPDLADRVEALARDAAALCGRPAPQGTCQLYDGALGGQYGAVTGAAEQAVFLAAQLEGLALEPVYTGKALAGLMACCRNGLIPRGRPVVLMHTGGLGGLLAGTWQPPAPTGR